MDSSSTATLKELTSALHDTLKYNGVLDKLKASARTEIHACLQAEELPPPTLPNENLVLNTLILEYLKFNNYNHAASVLLSESGQPTSSLDPSFIRSELGVKGGSGLPVLYGVVEALKQNKENNGKDIIAPSQLAALRVLSREVGGGDDESVDTRDSVYTEEEERGGDKGGMPEPMVFSNF
ncbi:hypothetical protein TrCOL_g11774 [Triparma columacea]|uniref:LisH domain-containing protein n=1 Tax=Triparma columacea TaxID=722753 RepID=A0A9W7FYE9_9STRA|nr:hypothetical protein TrCOL_g11774 [Triparma columacea]